LTHYQNQKKEKLLLKEKEGKNTKKNKYGGKKVYK